jgi:dolichyl-phosphate beta-glucosyltransferase
LPETITLIFPAFNEAARIESSVNAAVSYFKRNNLDYEIIVSADGNDGTREIVIRMGRDNPHLKAIGSVERRGKGHGIRQAVGIAQGKIIGFADADDKTPITEFDHFLPYLRDGWDIVIGSRGQRDSIIERSQPLYRQVGSMGFGVFMHSLLGMRDIVDTQCGFKFFRGEVIRDLFDRQIIDGYMYDVEILFLARQLGYRIQQVPVRWRDDGDSRLNLLPDNIQNVRDLLKIRFHQYDINSRARESA